MELAIETRTSWRDWFDAPDEVIATALDVLERRAAQVKRQTRGRGRRG